MTSRRLPLIILLLLFAVAALLVPNGALSAIRTNVWFISTLQVSLSDSISPSSTNHELPTTNFLFPPTNHELPTTNSHSSLLAARAEMAAGEYARVLALIDPLSQTDPVVLETRAELYFLLERYEEALVIWQRLGRYNKLEHAGRTLGGLGLIDLEISAWQKANTIRPDIYGRILADALLRRASALHTAGDLQAAILGYQEIIAQFPEEADAYLGLARSYVASGKPEIAIDLLDQAMPMPSASYPFFMGTGSVYEQTGDIEGAIRAYKLALFLNPNSLDPQRALDRLQTTPLP